MSLSDPVHAASAPRLPDPAAAAAPALLAADALAAMNRPIDALPERCDVLVVGAGPAGSAAATVLARAGLSVVLIDQQAFPRDKVCGDGLIPDAHHALRKLGVLDEVLALAGRAAHVGVIGPSGRRIDVPGTLAVLPRKQLDLIVCRNAVAAGASMHAPVRFVEPLLGAAPPDGGPPPVVGARLKSRGVERELRADWVVIASGAVPQALQAVDLCRRRTPSAVALRGYIHHPPMADRLKALDVVWHPKLRQGYGWIFPCGNGLFNIGVGIEHSHAHADADAGGDDKSMAQVNLREMLRTFGRIHPMAGELMAQGEWRGEVKGAPLRCSLAGADYSRPGLLVTGEAAGSTYAFTGEGIGKALETGMLAADTLIEGRRQAWADAALRSTYQQRLLALRPRYEVYERANAVNRRPWLVDLVIWSARRSPSRLKRMSGILEETHLPRTVLSVRGVLRLLFER